MGLFRAPHITPRHQRGQAIEVEIDHPFGLFGLHGPMFRHFGRRRETVETIDEEFLGVTESSMTGTPVPANAAGFVFGATPMSQASASRAAS